MVEEEESWRGGVGAGERRGSEGGGMDGKR